MRRSWKRRSPGRFPSGQSADKGTGTAATSGQWQVTGRGCERGHEERDTARVEGSRGAEKYSGATNADRAAARGRTMGAGQSGDGDEIIIVRHRLSCIHRPRSIRAYLNEENYAST